jgi:hypothetical protein
MLTLLNAVLQFVVRASDPSWTCELSHREPGMPGTYYLYCAQTAPSGVEIVSVGRFVPDAPALKAAP